MSEADSLDETRIAADAARVAAALTAADTEREDREARVRVARRAAQEDFDTRGLPRGLPPVSAL
jgi:hypothetical protein